MNTIFNKETGYSPMVSSTLSQFGFASHLTENRIETFHNKWLGDNYFHKVILFPNGMIEFVHYSFGRVFYGEVDNAMVLGTILEICFPDLDNIRLNND